MNGKTIRKLTSVQLFDIMMQSTKELINLNHTGKTKQCEAKKKEVQLLQKSIIEKISHFRPGPALL